MRGGGDGGIRARKDDAMDVREYQPSQGIVSSGDPKIPGRHLRSRSNRNHSKVSENTETPHHENDGGDQMPFLDISGVWKWQGNGSGNVCAHIFPKF